MTNSVAVGTFNVNYWVRVRLTDKGRKALKADHDRLYVGWKGTPPEYTAPIEDEDGWSRWQLWCLMEAIGPHIHIGGMGPIESEIILEPIDQRHLQPT